MGLIGFVFNVTNAIWTLIKLAVFIFVLGFLAALFLVASRPDFFNVW